MLVVLCVVAAKFALVFVLDYSNVYKHASNTHTLTRHAFVVVDVIFYYDDSSVRVPLARSTKAVDTRRTHVRTAKSVLTEL